MKVLLPGPRTSPLERVARSRVSAGACDRVEVPGGVVRGPSEVRKRYTQSQLQMILGEPQAAGQ